MFHSIYIYNSTYYIICTFIFVQTLIAINKKIKIFAYNSLKILKRIKPLSCQDQIRFRITELSLESNFCFPISNPQLFSQSRTCSENDEEQTRTSVSMQPSPRQKAQHRLCFIMCCWQWATGTHDLTLLFVGFRLVRWKIYFFSAVLCGPVCTGSETLTASISRDSSSTESGKRMWRLLKKKEKKRIVVLVERQKDRIVERLFRMVFSFSFFYFLLFFFQKYNFNRKIKDTVL